MKIRKILPFIPVIGIPLTYFYHLKFGDTGLENDKISQISSVYQVISLVVFFSLAIWFWDKI